MDDAAQVRERAVRLYALALQARERGYTSASELERLANETMTHAEELERRTRIVTPLAEVPQQVAQQQLRSCRPSRGSSLLLILRRTRRSCE
jgi:hypothetical protein